MAPELRLVGYRLSLRHSSIPVENILGHYETASCKHQGKTCPNFDMADLRKYLDLLHE